MTSSRRVAAQPADLARALGGVLAGAAGLVLGTTVVRTRTLMVPLAWHAAFYVPFYVFLACRVG